MTREQEISSAADLKAIGVNLATAGIIGMLIDKPDHRPLHVYVGTFGVVLFVVGKSWE